MAVFEDPDPNRRAFFMQVLTCLLFAPRAFFDILVLPVFLSGDLPFRLSFDLRLLTFANYP